MDGKSLDITEERLNKLKEILPDAFTEGKIDWEKLQASLGEDIEFKNERYVLNWAGKSDAFRVLQSPTTANLVPCKKESVGFDDVENIFMEGENAKIENILYELLLKSGIPLTAKIEEKDGYYLVNNDEIALILKRIDESIIKAVISEKPKKIITLDRLFKNNDQLKTNTALQMKDAGIEFKAV